MKILRVMADTPSSIALSELARQVNMAPSNVYPYLVSFCRSGMTVQDPLSNRYDLGPLAGQLGFAALRRMDGLTLGVEALTAAVQETRLDGHLCAWGPSGPIVLRWLSASSATLLRIQEGTTLPLLTSATGRVWAALLPRPTVALLFAQALKREAHASGQPVAACRTEVEKALAQVRKDGLAVSHGEQRRGSDAVSAPIRGMDGRIIYSITLTGGGPKVDVSPGGAAARALLSHCRDVSYRLGAPPMVSESV